MKCWLINPSAVYICILMEFYKNLDPVPFIDIYNYCKCTMWSVPEHIFYKKIRNAYSNCSKILHVFKMS